MSEDESKPARQSARIPISIPVVLSGLDAAGNKFSESVYTLIVNKHGGKIATTRHLPIGTKVLIENPALGVAARANVVWFREKQSPQELHRAGLQLLEAQNIWGIAFPPDRGNLGPEHSAPAATAASPNLDRIARAETETRLPSPSGGAVTFRLPQESRDPDDAHAREFQDRLKQLTERLAVEFESDLRRRAALVKAAEVTTLENGLERLRDSLSAARAEIGTLEAKIRELKGDLQTSTQNLTAPTPVQETRRQLTALTNSVVESMNRAAEAGLREYRSLLDKANDESAARKRADAEENTPPPPGSPAES